MKRIILLALSCLLAAVYTPLAGQGIIDKLADTACQCISKKNPDQMSTEDLQMQLGFCIMEAVGNNRRAFQKEYGELDFANQTAMNKLGEDIGMKMAFKCPEVIMRMAATEGAAAPAAKSKSTAKSSGTGFALSSQGYIVTNYHVVKGADKIIVRGIKGNFSKSYSAEIVAEDKNNDIAVIKINTLGFTTLGEIPYTINSNLIDVGSPVYALGYPLRATMGDEVKLTNGIISSKTGFQGDITTYQISVPVQPGNSGGPLINEKGEIVGIINAKHLGAENASYAIRTSYLMNLIQILDAYPQLPKINSISAKSLIEQVRSVKDFVYILESN